MQFTHTHKDCLAKSVLCWLATASIEGVPNVSPKEIFSYYESNKILVANIASPQTLRNIKANPFVCLSAIDILVQQGFQFKGQAEILTRKATGYTEKEALLTEMTKGQFPFPSITEITVTSVKPIIAPRYLLYPGTTSQGQIESAKKAYGF
ncbi:MAG: pyridoxamine 5'-phosphate oxidase family protein [Bacteroidota bacterium]